MAITDFEIMYMLAMIVTLKKISAKFANNCAINNLANELEIQLLSSFLSVRK